MSLTTDLPPHHLMLLYCPLDEESLLRTTWTIAAESTVRQTCIQRPPKDANINWPAEPEWPNAAASTSQISGNLREAGPMSN